VIYAGAAAISAAQLGRVSFPPLARLPGAAGKRSLGIRIELPYSWTNAVTLMVPNFWGDKVHSPYYGEWFVWEVVPLFRRDQSRAGRICSHRRRQTPAILLDRRNRHDGDCPWPAKLRSIA